MPVAPRISTVPSVPVSSWRWRSGSHEDMPRVHPGGRRLGRRPRGQGKLHRGGNGSPFGQSSVRGADVTGVDERALSRPGDRVHAGMSGQVPVLP
jgi:hypothetical protein